MDWFEQITGFREVDYEATQSRLSVSDGRLASRLSSKTWAIGRLETPALSELRERAEGLMAGQRRTRVQCIAADARELHGSASSAGALFQVASQFNLLEMVGPEVTPEHGVTRYQNDWTQGPACAIAAGAATIYRNYFVPVGDHIGQRHDSQVDCLRDIGDALGNQNERLWQMRNGYALCSAEGLARIDGRLEASSDEDRDSLRGLLRIGLHWQVEVTDSGGPGHRVSQAFCSALPVAYSKVPARNWKRFASLVLEAAYEATLLAALINQRDNGSGTVFLTQLGGGAFGNDTQWIQAAIRHAVMKVPHAGLDVRLVTRGAITPELKVLAATLTEHASR
jgi:hypothetical protein